MLGSLNNLKIWEILSQISYYHAKTRGESSFYLPPLDIVICSHTSFGLVFLIIVSDEDAGYGFVPKSN
jgi:hypothetical protein